MIKIKNIFLPEKINSYYIFSEHILVFELGYTILRATLIKTHRNKRTIKKIVEEYFTHNEPLTLVQAIKNCVNQLGNYTSVYIALPSYFATFKELTVPFTNWEKIKLILPFEVEPLLPWPLHDAVIDAVINATDQENNKSEIFVIALQKSVLKNSIDPFIEAGVTPSKVTLGIIELYGLIQDIPNYKQDFKNQGISVLIDLDNNATKIVITVNGKIKTIRILQQGIDPELMRLDLGVGKDTLSNESENFFSKIQFTIQATLKNENIHQPISTILITGIGSTISGIAEFISEQMNCTCKTFQPHKIIQDGKIVLENNLSIPIEFTTTITTGLSSLLTENFNLGKDYNEAQELSIFKKQIIVGGILLAIIIMLLGAYSFWNIRNLNKEIEQSREQTIERLIQDFKLNVSAKQKKSLSHVLNVTYQKLTLEESIWFALSNSKRFLFLHYLQELSSRVDRNDLGLQLKRLTIKSDEHSGQDTMILEGSVKDYDSLRTLEVNLVDSKLFVTVPKLQETKFNISLLINKNENGV